jgi:hypothetical protein
MGKSASAPPPPDYSAAARETASGNLDAARAATAANRVNQYTPYGSLEYNVSGQDPYGNPTWSATQSLAPAQQQLLDYQNQASLGLGNLTQKGLGYVSNMLDNPFDTSALPSTGFNPSQSYQDAYMQRLQPQIAQSQEALDVKLANAGIPIGSEAYKRAQMTEAQRVNDLLSTATTQGFGVGQQARQSALQEQAYLRNEPLNTLSAVRTGAQVQGPTFVNPAMQANTAGADILGATQMGYNAQMGAANAQNAANNQMTQGLFSLGGAALMASDIRMKENIKQIYWLPNGLPVYTYEYKDEFKDHPLAGHGTHTGVMAHEVEAMYPNAVITLDNGYKAVDYGQL